MQQEPVQPRRIFPLPIPVPRRELVGKPIAGVMIEHGEEHPVEVCLLSVKQIEDMLTELGATEELEEFRQRVAEAQAQDQ